METVNPNLKSCLNDLQVVVKSRTTKVVDKSRTTTLVSPKIEGVKQKKLKKQEFIKKNINTSKTQRIVTPVVQNSPNPITQNMFPRQPLCPPAPPFPVIPAGANPVVDPVTKQVFMPAFIPVPPGATTMGQALAYMPPFPGQQVGGPPNIVSPDMIQARDERERYDFSKRDGDKYHSSELDYFLGGTAQYLNEKSLRKRSQSSSNRSSSTNTRSDRFRKRRRYSPDRKSRSSFNRSLSYRSYERVESPRSRRYSSHSGSRSGSVHGSRHYSRSPFRSLSRSRSLSPSKSGSCHLRSHSRSPVSENSFRGSFLTVSEANSRDSVRDRSRERSRSRSHHSDQPYVDEPFSDLDQVSDGERNYSRSRYSENCFSPRHSYSPERDRFWNRSSSHRDELRHMSQDREIDRMRNVSPDFEREKYRHRSPGHDRDRYRHMSPEYERVVKKNCDGESIQYIRQYERVVKRNCEGESIRYIRKVPNTMIRHHRHHSHQEPQRDDLERVSDFEDVSDFEEVSEFEEISDNEGSVTWEVTKSEISYEVISDSEEPIVKDKVQEETTDKIIEIGLGPEDVKYDGYLNPTMNESVKENDFEEVSDNEMEFNDSQSHVKETVENKKMPENISDSATAFIKDVLAGLSSNNASQKPVESVDQTTDNKVSTSETSEPADNWNAVSKISTIHVYANLGLIKDENNELVYVGQGGSNAAQNETNITLSNQKKDTVLDESFQGYVKTLWQFPHKGVMNMSYTNFTDESEAYKDEFIAEVIHIILSLDLPYVTLNKLRNAIREKIKIQLSSVEELRQILILYPTHFILSKHAGSDSEDEDDPEMQTSKIRVNVKVEVRLCERHRALPFSKNVCTCNALHICPFYLLSNCTRNECSLGHDLKTPHNAEVIMEYRLHRSTLAELVEYMRNVDHRTIDTVPTICKFYNRRRGCAKESEVDDEELCIELHLCFFFAMDSCRKGEECELAHDFTSGQPLIVLQKFGLDPKTHGEFNVLSLVRSFLRARRQELDKLNEKLADKSLTENELKLCIARGFNPKLLQMTKRLKGHPLITATVQDAEKNDTENQETPKQGSATSVTTDEPNTEKLRTTLSLQMQAQKALVEKALLTLDEEKDSPSSCPVDPKAVIPIICKFYNNETGCARSNEVCEFIHVCHHYVMGDCKYYGRCKRSHDLTSGQPGNILYRLGIVDMTENEIIGVLRRLCGETLVGVDV